MTTTDTKRHAIPGRGDQIDYFTATGSDGEPIRTRDYYMRRNLALVFSHGPDCAACRDLLRGLARQYAAARAEDGQVIAVVAAEPAAAEALRHDLDLPFPVVADADLAVHARFGLVEDGAPLAAIFVTDRYGTIYDASVADATHQMMAPEEVPGWLEFVACEC